MKKTKETFFRGLPSENETREMSGCREFEGEDLSTKLFNSRVRRSPRVLQEETKRMAGPANLIETTTQRGIENGKPNVRRPDLRAQPHERHARGQLFQYQSQYHQ